MRLAAVLVLCACALCQQENKAPELNVVLISWDGCEPVIMKEMLKADELPNLKKLIEDGSWQDMKLSADHQTQTKPGHVEMLTGLASEKTGTTSNNKFKPLPKGYTIPERLEAKFGDENIETIFLAGKDDNLGSKKGEPYENTKGELDEFENGLGYADKVGPKVVEKLKKVERKAFFLFAHFADPDLRAHKYGDGKQYREAIKLCDEWLGKIRAQLNDKTLVYLTTDHGRDKVGNYMNHIKAPDIWLATNDKEIKHGGNLCDVPATILKHYGIDAGKVEPPLAGKPLYP